MNRKPTWYVGFYPIKSGKQRAVVVPPSNINTLVYYDRYEIYGTKLAAMVRADAFNRPEHLEPESENLDPESL